MNRRTHCHCDELLPLPSRKCIHGCSEFSDPDWLRLQKRKRQARDAHARREERFTITAAEIRRMRSAMRKMDPIYAAQSKQGRRSALKRYFVGGAK